MLVVRAALALYLLVLSFLLLAPEPLELLGFSRSPDACSLRMVHFALFAVLGFLVWASRWPVRAGVLVGLLVGYALVTETLQWFVPTRTVELLDYVENLLGLVAGGAAWQSLRKWGVNHLHRGEREASRNDEGSPAEGEQLSPED